VIGTPVVVGVTVGAGVPVAGVSTDAGAGVFVGDINTVGAPSAEDSGDGVHDGVGRGVDAVVGSEAGLVASNVVDRLQAAPRKANTIIVTHNRFPIPCSTSSQSIEGIAA
jgi:hypothetical protein